MLHAFNLQKDVVDVQFGGFKFNPNSYIQTAMHSGAFTFPSILFYLLEKCEGVCGYSQQRTLMQAACRLFSARISDLMPMTKRFPKQVKKAMTQTDTRSTMLARRSSKDEMPSVLGLQDLT